MGMTLVGKITGMVDCQWADSAGAVRAGRRVPLGRKYVLSVRTD